MYNTYKHHPKGSYVHLYGLDGMFMFIPPEERSELVLLKQAVCMYVIRCNIATMTAITVFTYPSVMEKGKLRMGYQ
jgi:hypothetical protein